MVEFTPTVMQPWRITIHCSDTKNGCYVDPKEIDQWHRDRGFLKIGYHYLIEPDGELVGYPECRALNQEGAHVSGANKGNIGICLIGRDKFKREQWKQLDTILTTLIQTFNIKADQIYCHNEFISAQTQSKPCPNFSVRTLYAWYYGGQIKVLEPLIKEDDNYPSIYNR